MPPRRATRSASASVPPEEKAPTSRRKRGRSEVDGDATKEIVEKPPSRATKPPSTTSRTRTSARSRTVLKGVPESEEEEEPVEDSPPPVKRRRGVPKEEPAAVSDGTMHQDPPPRKGRSAASSRASANTSRARTSVAVKDEEDDEVEEISVPTRRSARSSAQPKPEPSSVVVPSEKSKRQPVRSGRKLVVVSDADSDVVEISAAEVASLKSKTRASTAGRSNSRAGPSKAPVKQKDPSPAPIPEPEPEPEPESIHDHPFGAHDDEPPPTTPKPSPKKAPPPPAIESDEEEPSVERSPVRIPATQAPPLAPEEPEGPRPRLVIHKIALVNFKSYAGRQEIGPFHKVRRPHMVPPWINSHLQSFSAIVGPNGSGKSNTIDALLFVFGYRASKMRQGKLSELIHNSDRYPNLQQCSVEIHFREIIDLVYRHPCCPHLIVYRSF